MTKRNLPESFREYFWDIDFDRLSIDKSYFLIIKRILDRGDTGDIKWLLANYEPETIKRVLVSTKDLSRITGNFWANTFNLDKKDMLCLQKPYSPTHFGLLS